MAVPGDIRKQAEQGTRNKPVNSVAPQRLHQPLPPVPALSYCPEFSQ